MPTADEAYISMFSSDPARLADWNDSLALDALETDYAVKKVAIERFRRGLLLPEKPSECRGDTHKMHYRPCQTFVWLLLHINIEYSMFECHPDIDTTHGDISSHPSQQKSLSSFIKKKFKRNWLVKSK